MQHVLIIHEVKDYSIWKGVFDNASGIRKSAGELSYQVLTLILFIWISLRPEHCE